jgi:hypothetical protein
MKRFEPQTGPDLTEKLIEANPERYREYHDLERAFSDPYSPLPAWTSAAEESHAWERYGELFRFFRFEFCRKKYNTAFWGNSTTF